MDFIISSIIPEYSYDLKLTISISKFIQRDAIKNCTSSITYDNMFKNYHSARLCKLEVTEPKKTFVNIYTWKQCAEVSKHFNQSFSSIGSNEADSDKEVSMINES